MNRNTDSETRNEIFGKMMLAWGGETNVPSVTATSKAKMMRISFRGFLSGVTMSETQKQIFEMVNDVSFDLMPMAGRLWGLSGGFAAIEVAAQEGIDGINDPKEVLGAIIDFVGELEKYNVSTLNVGRDCSRKLHAIGEKIIASK